MMAVIEFHDMESAAIDVKVNVPLFEVRRNGFPNLDLRMKFFYRAPGSVSDAFAVSFRSMAFFPLGRIA